MMCSRPRPGYMWAWWTTLAPCLTRRLTRQSRMTSTTPPAAPAGFDASQHLLHEDSCGCQQLVQHSPACLSTARLPETQSSHMEHAGRCGSRRATSSR